MADDNRPKGFYLAYLERYGHSRRAEGHEVPDVADQAYWDKRREDELLKDQPLRKAA